MGDEVRWREHSDDSYDDRAAESFNFKYEPAQEPERIVFHGPCPNCAHGFSFIWPLAVVRTAVATSTTATKLPVTLYCRCEHAHPGRPDDEVGCGAYWKLKVPRP